MQVIATGLVAPAKLFRDGLNYILAHSRYRIDCEAASVSELVRQGPVDLGLVLVDPNRAAETAVAEIRRLRSILSTGRIVVLRDEAASPSAAALLEAGADGCVGKEVAPEAMIEALARVARGERVGAPPAAPSVRPGERPGLPGSRRPPVHGRDMRLGNREQARRLCRELGHLDAVRACKENGWYMLLKAIQAERLDALRLARPVLGAD